MERFLDVASIPQIKSNTVIGTPTMSRAEVIFQGENNILYCEEGVNLASCKITFTGSNAVVYLSSSNKPYLLNLSVNNDCTAFLGRNNYFNSTLYMIVSEHCNVLIGNHNLFSFGCWVRTADAHLLYDAKTHERINLSRGVFVGDHTWLGQGALIFKGTQVGSGSVVGAAAMVSGKTIGSNSVWGGNPAHLIRENVFFTDNSVHAYMHAETQLSLDYGGDDYIYRHDPAETIAFSAIDEALRSRRSAAEKKDYLVEFVANQGKNRFFVPSKGGGSSAAPLHSDKPERRRIFGRK